MVDRPKTITGKMHLKERTRIVFEESGCIYGSYRVRKMLEREGLKYPRSYIAVLMRSMGLKSILGKKYIITTDSNHSFPIPGNKLDRAFNCLGLGKKWVSDITYIRVGEHWDYPTTILDLADRKVVGWSLSEDMTAQDTIIPARANARRNREIKYDFVFHSDRVVQYAPGKVSDILSFNKKITQGMSGKGNCRDNAVAESFFKTIEHECPYRYKFKSFLQLHHCTHDYIRWYNSKRTHSGLGYLTPLEKEMELRRSIKNVA